MNSLTLCERSNTSTMLGYSLTADTSEKAAFVCNGLTDTGKTTLLCLIVNIFGDYATTIPIEALMVKVRNNATEEQLALLRGARLVVTSETEKGQRLAIARLKQITQGQNAPIQVVPKYKPLMTFPETHKLFMDCNYPPAIVGGDDAIWNRLRVIPFKRRFAPEEQDRTWCRKTGSKQVFRHCGVFYSRQQRHTTGLPIIEEMQQERQDWREHSQPLRLWLEECCLLEVTYNGADAELPPST